MDVYKRTLCCGAQLVKQTICASDRCKLEVKRQVRCDFDPKVIRRHAYF